MKTVKKGKDCKVSAKKGCVRTSNTKHSLNLKVASSEELSKKRSSAYNYAI